jgi:predicted transcriptional regulator
MGLKFWLILHKRVYQRLVNKIEKSLYSGGNYEHGMLFVVNKSMKFEFAINSVCFFKHN